METETETQTSQNINLALNFINTNRNQILKIYENHNNKDGAGIIVLTLLDDEPSKRIDVSYITNEHIPEELLNKILKRIEANTALNKHIIYIYLITPLEETLVELETRI